MSTLLPIADRPEMRRRMQRWKSISPHPAAHDFCALRAIPKSALRGLAVQLPFWGRVRGAARRVIS